MVDLDFNSIDYYVDSLYEEYQLEYELYMIEKSAFKTFAKINNVVIQENYDNDIEMIQESMKETLTIWITRFTEAIQNALNKFMDALDGAQDLAYLKSIEGAVKELKEDPGFSVNNIRNYKEEIIHNFKIQDFNTVYNSNKDSLQSQDQFLIQNYSNLGFANGKTDIKQVIEDTVVDVVKDPVAVKVDLIKGYYNWCRNDYVNDINPIKAAMNVYNNSSKSILGIINNLPDDFKNKEETQGNPDVTPKGPEGKQESASLINEDQTTPSITNTSGATNDGNKGGNPAKMTFDDKVDYIAKAKGAGSNQEVVNAVRNYLSCTSRILSTLFIIIKNRKADYLRVLKHVFPMNRETRQAAQATTTITPNQTKSQVDTSRLP